MLKRFLLVPIIATLIAATAAVTTSAVSLDPCSTVQSELCGGSTDPTSLVGIIVKVLMFVVGAVAVIIIVIAGIMYVTSAGDPGKAKKAKDAILYAVIGLVVAIFAYAITTFVVQNTIV